MLDTFAPIFTSEAVTVVFSTSEKFAPFCSAAILSLLDHASSQRCYDIIVLESGMLPNTKDKYKQLFDGRTNAHIRFYNVSGVLGAYRLGGRGWWTVDTYARLLIPDLLPKHTKAIYIDGDQIVLGDIAELFDIDLEGASIGACRDVGAASFFNSFEPEGFKKYLLDVVQIKKENISKYFSSSTLLLDLENIRKKYSYKQLLQYAEEKNFDALDLHVFNSLFQDDVKLLPLEWGWFSSVKEDSYGDIYSRAPKDLYQEYLAAGDAPKVIHYGGKEKPWECPNRACAEQFWSVFRRTPFYALFLEEKINSLSLEMNEVHKVVAMNQQWIDKIQSCIPYRVIKKIIRPIKRGELSD